MPRRPTSALDRLRLRFAIWRLRGLDRLRFPEGRVDAFNGRRSRHGNPNHLSAHSLGGKILVGLGKTGHVPILPAAERHLLLRGALVLAACKPIEREASG